ncbi:hypothetical protein K1T71_004498 [Dendrolimus kikuchii]|uniref:Uncharacterized protein n=1 Tax=Dendrolimus kikuchii TaxID=765133 RepID=A0ACC1D8L2_9NEOP|nr:hypothetical protein K1T71_004498 [Dendrolimus kikuchii]
MFLKRFGLIVLLICLQNVFIICSENILLQGRYNFNHPPSVEDYNPLSIIINHNDEETAGKSAIDPDNYKSEIELISAPAKELVPLVPITYTTSETNIGRVQSDERLKGKGRALNGQEIPVTVIYDTEVENDNLYREVKPKLAEGSQTILKVQTSRQQKQLTFKDGEKDNQDPKNDGLQTGPVTPFKNQKRNRERDPVVPIVESENFIYAYRGDYRYGYESGDGTKAFGKGELRRFSDNSTGEAVQGSFSYKDKEGNNYSLTYTADENGYRPVGDHLPTPPPLPPAIERALRYLATKNPESVTEKL